MTPGKYLWVNTDGQNGWLWKSLASGLGKRLGLRPLLIVQSEQDKRHYLKQDPTGFDGEIVVREDVYGAVVSGISLKDSVEEVHRSATEIEMTYAIAIVRDLLMSDRHLGRGYMLGGKGYGKSKTSRAATFDASLAGCVRMFRQAEAMFKRYAPGLMICLSSPQGIFGRPFAEVCRKNGISLRCLESGRLGSIFYWAEDPFENSLAFEQVYASTPNPTEQEVEEARQAIAPNSLQTSAGAQAYYRRSTTLPYVARWLLTHTARYYYGRLRGYRKAFVGPGPLDRAREAISLVRQFHFLDRHGLRDLSRFSGRRKVFFPLQVEPEQTTTAIDVFLPNQMAIIHDIAISLPPDAVLLVKEHIWQFGLRDLQFYRALLDMPNVALVHHDIKGIDLVRQCDLICTMTGSTGHEAAMLGIPVIRYGQQGTIFVLPHVHRAQGRGDMALIRSLLNETSVEARWSRSQAGARYAKAMSRFGFDLAAIDFFSRRTPLADDELDELCRHLLGTLDASDFDRAA